MFKTSIKNLKSQKGMSGVLVAVLLVVVGVGLVGGVKLYMEKAQGTVEKAGDAAITKAITTP